MNKKFNLVSCLIFSAIMIFNFGCGVKIPQSGNAYQAVSIGNLAWMTENLNVSHFRNGDNIPEAKTNEEWEKAGKEGRPAWCYYNNDPENGKKYGKLYNWFAVNDPRGLAPEGWHIPGADELEQLAANYGGRRVGGTALKSASGWAEDRNGTNESGFNGLPGGIRTENGKFDYIGVYGYFWSSTNLNNFYANYRYLYSHSRYLFGYISYFKPSGFSVRCVRD